MASVYDVASLFISLAQAQSDNAQGDQVTNLRLQKLLYFAQGWSLALRGKPLFAEDLAAWHYGPVVPCVYEKYKSFGRDGISADAEPDFHRAFSPEELALLLDVARAYDPISTSRLVELSHCPGGPWATTQQGSLISKESIRQAFAKEEKPLLRFDPEAAFAETEIVEPLRSKDGAAIIPQSFAEDWDY